VAASPQHLTCIIQTQDRGYLIRDGGVLSNFSSVGIWDLGFSPDVSFLGIAGVKRQNSVLGSNWGGTMIATTHSVFNDMPAASMLTYVYPTPNGIQFVVRSFFFVLLFFSLTNHFL
jgi:hypothetical protein